MARVLGIDAGIAHIGAAIAVISKHHITVENVFLFETAGISAKRRKKETVSKAGDDYRRIREAMVWLDALVAEHKPTYIVAELPIGGAPNAGAAKYLAMAATVLVHMELTVGFPIVLLSPYDVKRGFCGKTKADKAEIIERAYRKCGECAGWPKRKDGTLHPSCEHPADAIAAIYAARHFKRI